MDIAEKVAVLTAINKRVKQELDKCRDELDAMMIDNYLTEGSMNKELRVMGESVGKATVRLSKPSFAIDDMESLIEFAKDYGFAVPSLEIKPEYRHHALAFLSSEFPEAISENWVLAGNWENLLTITRSGIKYMDSDSAVPGVSVVPAQPKNVAITGCEFDDVREIINGLPGGFNSLLLEA